MSKSAFWAHGALCAAIVALACAACGGGAGGAAPPQAPAAPSASESPAVPSAGPETPPAGSAAPAQGVGPSLSPGEPFEMKAPIPTAMADDLRALGIDVKKLPPIEKLEPRMLRGAMKLLAKSLGARCGDCHQEGDFAAPTRRKKIAAKMWDEFAAKMALSPDGNPSTPTQPLFCDSCHQGHIQVLDRRDKKALSKWMDDNFVGKLARKDGKATECETCHVDMEMHFLAKWGGTAVSGL